MVRNTLTDEMVDDSSHDFGKMSMCHYKTLWAICKEFNDKTDNTYFVRKKLGNVIVYKNPKEAPKEDRGEQAKKRYNAKKLKELREVGVTNVENRNNAIYLSKVFEDGPTTIRKQEDETYSIYNLKIVEPPKRRRTNTCEIEQAIIDDFFPVHIVSPTSMNSTRVKAYKLAKKYGVKLGTIVDKNVITVYKKED